MVDLTKYVWVACIAGSMMRAAVAAEWTVEPMMNWSSEFRDNPYLSLDKPEAWTMNSLEARLHLQAQSETTEFDLTPRARALKSSGSSALDGDEYALDGLAVHEFAAGTLQANASTARQTTLTSEWTNTGIVDASKWMNTWSVNPSWRYENSERSSTQFEWGAQQRSYEHAERTALVGYDQRWLGATYAREWRERWQSRFNVKVSRVAAPVVDAITDSGEFLGALAYADDIDSASLSLGGHRTRDKTGARSSWSTGVLSAIEYRRETAHGSLAANASRALEPSGYGILIARESAGVDAQRDIGERWSGTMSVAVHRDAALARSVQGVNRRYAEFGWRLSWEAAEEWTVSAGVNYQRQRFVAAPTAAEGASFQLNIAYRGMPKPVTARGAHDVDDSWN